MAGSGPVRISWDSKELEILDSLSPLREFAEQSQAYNNTSVYLWDGYVWVDSLKGPQVFERHLPKDKSLEILRLLSANEQEYAWTGEGQKPAKQVKIGNLEGIGHVYRVQM